MTGWKRNAAVNDWGLECRSRHYPCGLLCQHDACHCLAQSCEKVKVKLLEILAWEWQGPLLSDETKVKLNGVVVCEQSWS